jgi:hypothetical protein
MVGGVRAYKELCPNSTFSTDGFICRIGFMDLNDAKNFVCRVAESGLLKTPTHDDFVIVDAAPGFLPRPDWLVFGNYRGMPIVCLEGNESANLFVPECEMDSKQEVISLRELRESYDLVETRENIAHYVHKVTGRHIHIGRTDDSSNVAAQQIRDNPNEGQYKQSGWRQVWKRIRSHF